jgi:anthranilate phosphoribosyltransferase
MKTLLEELYIHKTLSKATAKQLLMDIVSEKYNPYQIASFLTVLIMRKVTVEELKGFRDALLELMIPINLKQYDPIDVCGTGGDGKNTFNISTLTAFIVAGAGIPVAKHGNYGASSISGSSNVLEQLGVRFQTSESKLQQQIEAANICFLHAPLFHPSLKYVAPIRKQLGVKTFFNMLGPLVNPAQPKVQCTGVFNMELARMYHYLFQEDEQMKYSIIHSSDGYDEIVLTETCKIISNKQEYQLSAEDFGFKKNVTKDLYGGNTIEEAANIFLNIIQGKGTNAQIQVVLANAAIAIQTYYPEKKLEETVALASESLFQLKAFNSLQKIKQII